MARWFRQLALLLGIPGAALGVIVATATPAFASQGGMCETFGSWCIGGDFEAGVAVHTVSPPGRTMTFAPGPGGTGVIHPASGTGSSLCLAPISASNLIIAARFCNVTGVSWTWVQAGTTHYFVSVHYSGLRLSGTSVKGDPLAACPAGGCNGNWTLQQWTGP